MDRAHSKVKKATNGGDSKFKDLEVGAHLTSAQAQADATHRQELAT